MKTKDKEGHTENNDFENIFALNMGNFVAEHFISKDLLKKISSSIDIRTKLKSQLKELVSIYSIDNTLNLLGFDTDENYIIFDAIAKTLVNIMQVDACHIFMKPEFIHKPGEEGLFLVGSSVINKPRDFKYESNNQGFECKSFNSGKFQNIHDVSTIDNWNKNLDLEEDKVVSYMSAPIKGEEGPVGVIVLQSYRENMLSKEAITLLQSTANLFVISMRLQELLEETNFVIDDKDATEIEMTHLRAKLTESIGDLGVEQKNFVESLASASDARSDYTKKHSIRVAKTARNIAKAMNLNEKTMDLVYYAGLLKNIGKITLASNILDKKNLSQTEWEKLQNHPNVGVNLLMKINFLSEVVPYVHYHSERWDGKGKPEGLSGMSIPLGSRIIAVADAYEALIEDRAYRKSASVDKAIKIVQEEAGTKWDPMVVEALKKFLLHQ